MSDRADPEILELINEIYRDAHTASNEPTYVDPEDMPVDGSETPPEVPVEEEHVPEEPAVKAPSISPLEATLVLARRGSKKVLPLLRRALDEHPELVSYYGSLTLQVQERWLQLIAGKDLLLSETMRCHLDQMRTELVGPKPSPLDKLLVDRIVATHVQLLYYEAMEPTDPTGENMRVARYRMDRRDQAHRQLLAAVKTLAMVRNLVARTKVIQIELLNPPMVHPPTAPAAPAAHVERPAHTGTKNRVNTAAAGPASPLNGNRMAGVMQSITAGDG